MCCQPSSLQQSGAPSLRTIAKGLNEAAIPTALGCGTWSATQVRNVTPPGLALGKRPALKSNCPVSGHERPPWFSFDGAVGGKVYG
jgi:hypothetical protein